MKNENKKISKEELKSLLEKGEDVLVVDVMNPEFYSEAHIKGAKNAPVYEVAFLEHMGKIAEDKNKRIVIYDDNEKSFALEDAALKLAKSGFTNVEMLSENLAAWIKAGYPVEKGEAVKVSAASDGKHELDTEKSLFSWIGRNAKYAHRGKIVLESGFVTWENGKLTGGEFILDMRTIADEDLADPVWKNVLESHLKSSDFFEVEQYPQAKFVIQKVEKLENALVGTANHKISGDLTIKDTTRQIDFAAMIVPMEDGSINGQAHFDFDRTLWNVRYGSEKFFAKLGMHLVNDVVSVEMFLVAKPQI